MDPAIHCRHIPTHRSRDRTSGFAQGGGPERIVETDAGFDSRHCDYGRRRDHRVIPWTMKRLFSPHFVLL